MGVGGTMAAATLRPSVVLPVSATSPSSQPSIRASPCRARSSIEPPNTS